MRNQNKKKEYAIFASNLQTYLLASYRNVQRKAKEHYIICQWDRYIKGHKLIEMYTIKRQIFKFDLSKYETRFSTFTQRICWAPHKIPYEISKLLNEI